MSPECAFDVRIKCQWITSMDVPKMSGYNVSKWPKLDRNPDVHRTSPGCQDSTSDTDVSGPSFLHPQNIPRTSDHDVSTWHIWTILLTSPGRSQNVSHNLTKIGHSLRSQGCWVFAGKIPTIDVLNLIHMRWTFYIILIFRSKPYSNYEK